MGLLAQVMLMLQRMQRQVGEWYLRDSAGWVSWPR